MRSLSLLQLEARAQERLRVARDLHDTPLQGAQGLLLRFRYATEQIQHYDGARDMSRVALIRADEVIREGSGKVREMRARERRFAGTSKAIA